MIRLSILQRLRWALVVWERVVWAPIMAGKALRLLAMRKVL